MSMRRAAGAGAVAAFGGLAASELVAGLFPAVPSLVEAVGEATIDRAPKALKDWAIATFGTADKAVLVVGIALVVTALGAGVGVLAERAGGIGAVGFGVLAAVGASAAAATSTPLRAAAAGMVAWTAAAAALAWLRNRMRPRPGQRADADGATRRSFLTGVGGVVVLAVLAGVAGRLLGSRAQRILSERAAVALPPAVEGVAPPPAAAAFDVPGLSPLVTPNQDFYRIDTTMSVPRVDLADWRLRVGGMVDRPYELTFEELARLDMVERWVTLSCVSNPVGGSLVGNAKWLGVPLAALVERAGVRAGATQVVGRAIDGFTVGFPASVVHDGRDALVAVGMNDEPLPPEHGFPARLVVAGLYGYVSATKWLTDLELTTWDGFDAYWVPRGWAKEAPVKTQSRIDTPRGGTRLGTRPRMVAGVAWAPGIGIDRVEVQLDDGAWQDAELAEPIDANCWRQWRLPWTPTPGVHVLRVRATDATGRTQTPVHAPPEPDGATGWHTIRVAVVG